MAEHPIQGLMQTSMENIKKMVEVNTIVGEPVQTPDGSIILPISKVGFGFAAGGSEFQTDDRTKAKSNDLKQDHADVALPFGGGSGGGVSITPIAFLVVGTHGVRIVSLDNQTHLVERVIDSIPQFMEKYQTMMENKSNAKSSANSTMNPPEPSGYMPPSNFSS
ncbi:GerW family sporulation protein [Paenibacillus guangzhouensis]|uniref:GerW family sporulation protein n=1 Tax=Paenibacillus guangzhouensis TaxID=1473112 RepID=UPI001266B353|nr:GerW family sporulation protein [Paenibacillus guangzhouensis]